MNDPEATIADLQRKLAAAHAESERIDLRYRELLDTVPGAVWEAWGRPDAANQQIDFVSKGMERMVGYNIEEWLNTPNFWLTIVHPDDRAAAGGRAAQGFQSGQDWLMQFRWIRKDKQIIWVEAYVSVIKAADGTPLGLRGVNVDITERRAIEDAKLAQEAVLQAQKLALVEISTPLIPIFEQVVIMPIVGSIDRQRAQLIIQSLLEGVAELRTRVVILDITGVPVVDTHVASVLLQATRAVQLLGAEVVLTGIRPEIAQTMVGLGLNMQEFLTLSSLQSAVAYALTRVIHANPTIKNTIRAATTG